MRTVREIWRLSRRDPRRLRIASTSPAVGAGDIAWIAAAPCALLTLVAVVLLGAPLGRALFTPGPVQIIEAHVRPEPAEHARYLIAALAPVALSTLVLVAGRGRSVVGSGWRPAARIAEVGLLAFVVLTLVALRVWTYTGKPERYNAFRVYFTIPTFIAAAAIAALIVASLHSDGLSARLRDLAQETPVRRASALVVAVLFTAIWLLTAFNTEGSIGLTDLSLRINIPYWLDETFAVLDGLMPLAGFHAQYAQMWPYVTAGAMAVFGTTFAVYSVVMIAGTIATMTAVYTTLRRVVRSSLAALALFAPFVATSFFKEQGTLVNRYGPSNLFTVFPIRYGGPYVLLWLVVRRLDGGRPRNATVLLFVAGMVAVNNADFGMPAFAATVLTLLLTLPNATPRAAARVIGAAVAGAAGALLAVALLTLLAAGSLPRYSQLLEFSRIFALDGFGMLPMPGFGFHYAIYVTFAGALALAAVRTAERRTDVRLTGMLCWLGVFGLGAGSYYAGRSHPEVLIDLFSAWALALAVLVVAVARAIRARPSRLPGAAEIAVLACFGLSVCSIGQTPAPWSQIDRMQRTTIPVFRPLAAEQFVRARSVPGEHVMIAADLGHRIAYDIGVVDDFPYTNINSMPTREQWLLALHTAQREQIHSFFVPTSITLHAVEILRAGGYQVADAEPEGAGIVQLTR